MLELLLILTPLLEEFNDESILLEETYIEFQLDKETQDLINWFDNIGL